MSAPAPPQERLGENVRWLWRAHGLLAAVGVAAVGTAAGRAIDAGWLGAALAVLVAVIGVGVVPELRYRRWRIALDDERLDLRHGAFTVKRTLVPMRRVQHVDTAADLLERTFSVAHVTVHTAGGEIAVPGLDAKRAAALAQRIAELARVDDD